jgi:glycosyltransferase involved in cell wall biosynthesis
MKPSLVVDARWLKTGIGRYTSSLIQNLRQHLPDVEIISITHAQYADTVAKYCDRVIISNTKIYSIQEQLSLPLHASHASLFYAPHYNIPVLWDGKLLVTIHDLNHILDKTYSKNWKSILYARPLLNLAASRSDIVVTPSQYTKCMLQKYLGIEQERIVVIPCPISDTFHLHDKMQSRMLVRKNFGVDSPFLLFVGNLAPNKNLRMLLSTLARLLQIRQDVPTLVIVGGGEIRRHELQEYARGLSIDEHVKWLENIADSSLAFLYAAAEATIMPSLEEGFGLPIVESMACGTPVICSDAASFPEIAKDAAIFFDPYSLESLLEAITRLIDSTETQQWAIESGLKRAQQFSIERFIERQTRTIRALLPS